MRLPHNTTFNGESSTSPWFSGSVATNWKRQSSIPCVVLFLLFIIVDINNFEPQLEFNKWRSDTSKLARDVDGQKMMPGAPGHQFPQQVAQALLLRGLGSMVASNQMPLAAMQPVGLAELEAHCSILYPRETQLPVCRKPEKSLIVGGSEPLELINIYKNPPNIENFDASHQPHWHYVSFGLSDIYNYSYLYKFHNELRAQDEIYAKNLPPLRDLYPVQKLNNESGFGIELTFRLKCNSLESWHEEPPEWPVELLQALAKYIFQSKNVVNAGDHFALNRPLDGADSEIRHMLMTLDPELKETETSLGRVKFIQIVGVCDEELQAARQWNVRGLLELMKSRDDAGGPLFVTDMTRGASIFDLDPSTRDIVDEAIDTLGSNLVQISATHKYSASKPKWFKEVERLENSRENDEEENSHREYSNEIIRYSVDHSVPGVERGCLTQLTLSRDDVLMSDCLETNMADRVPSRMSYESESGLLIQNAELRDIRKFESIYLLLSLESARCLQLALCGRLARQRHFSYQNCNGDLLTTFVPEGSEVDSIVSSESRFAKSAHWLQIYVSEQLRSEMLATMRRVLPKEENEKSRIKLPMNISWHEHKFHLTIVQEINDLNEAT